MCEMQGAAASTYALVDALAVIFLIQSGFGHGGQTLTYRAAPVDWLAWSTLVNALLIQLPPEGRSVSAQAREVSVLPPVRPTPAS